jgi:hypothetical protein
MTKKEKFFKTKAEGYSTTRINYSGYSYGRHYGGMTNIYGYSPDGSVFDYIVTYHRSKVIARMIRNGTWWALDISIRDNYSTNGYTTRVGIIRANKKRCSQLSESHKILPFGGKNAHDARVILRNKF